MGGIYIHFPFCTKKCIYCNFYSNTSLSLKSNYIKALQKEIELTAHYLPSSPIETLYFGGGTPSLLTPHEISSIIVSLKRYYHFCQDIEITFEVNPEALSLEYLKTIHSLGINRLSIGIQSFNDEILHFLGRRHTQKEARLAIERAQIAGFENISIDLIYGIEKRDFSIWKNELDTAFSYPISHLSAYALSIEENTLLGKKIDKGDIKEAHEQQFIDEFFMLLEKSEKAHFEQYEISNFAKNNLISKHNYAYWSRKPYLGLGPSSHSFNGKSRKWNVANTLTYIQDIANNRSYFSSEQLSPIDHFNEFIFLQLRTKEGLNTTFIAQHFGKEKATYIEQYFRHLDTKYYQVKNNTYYLTHWGKLILDHISTELYTIER